MGGRFARALQNIPAYNGRSRSAQAAVKRSPIDTRPQVKNTDARASCLSVLAFFLHSLRFACRRFAHPPFVPSLRCAPNAKNAQAPSPERQKHSNTNAYTTSLRGRVSRSPCLVSLQSPGSPFPCAPSSVRSAFTCPPLPSAALRSLRADGFSTSLQNRHVPACTTVRPALGQITPRPPSLRFASAASPGRRTVRA